ncbi:MULTISPECIES: hypothetical protein [Sinorhizobium/Ensifer group]|uniref:hypothetical protein n=1 Tax=Sinorhizobium/Ensifer group TaxID=227292 RepID=UPI000A0F9A1F|nr:MULTISPECIES: hypothetical protein [Sinorhizobium/Ensifer group]RVJ48628.1 hypothetical protein CN175_23685 [Sinorhizobium meliloti]
MTKIILALTFLVLAILGFGAWVVNIFKLVGMVVANEPITAMFIARIAGIPLVFLGSFLGWF